MKLHTLLLCACLPFVFFACGQDDASTFSTTETPTPLMVIMGGNSTCDGGNSPQQMGLVDPFVKLRERLSKTLSKEIPYLLSCFVSGGSKIYYEMSNHPGELRTGSINVLSDDLLDLYTDTVNPSIMLAGHSYGGWLALKLSQALLDNAAKAFALFTIDPISRESCTFLSPINCTSAPDDISNLQYDDIAANTVHFINFYQTQTFYLHSSPIASARENIRVNTSHTRMDTHPNVWNRIDAIAVQPNAR